MKPTDYLKFFFRVTLTTGCIVLVKFYSLNAQSVYDAVDTWAKQLSTHQKVKKTTEISKAITQKYTNEADRVRAAFVWITESIVYDFAAFRNGDQSITSPNQVIQSGKAVCQGYAELFRQLCKEMTIPCYVVTGYSKGYGYRPGRVFKQTDHAWNTVKIGSVWYLLDVTWGAGYINEDEQYVKNFNPKHFFSDPREFVLTHLPTDPMWQLMAKPISLKLFEKDSLEIKKQVTQAEFRGGYLDTLEQWFWLDSATQILQSNFRTTRHFPENNEAWYQISWHYYQLAWQKMAQLNDPYFQKDKSKSVPIAKEAINLLLTADKYLDEINKRDNVYKDEIKVKKQNIKNNLANLKWIAGEK